MYHGYSVSHEKLVWDARLEPGVLSAFEKIWNTSNLLVSFDGINLTLPLPQPLDPIPRHGHTRTKIAGSVVSNARKASSMS
jgi:hypothetical protein